MKRRNVAIAKIWGITDYAELYGEVIFRQYPKGVLVVARIYNLPSNDFFGFHIHEGTECSGTNDEQLLNTGGHYNPNNLPHPSHSGDLPPLLSCQGVAYMSVFTDRFSVQDIIGRTVVIHRNPDDFKTQPSGNAGEKIACGVIY